MRLLASFTVLALVVLGLAGIAQAGSSVPACASLEFAILECKTNSSGDIVVFAFTEGTNGNVEADIEVGDDCTQALESLDDPGNGNDGAYFPRHITTGSTDRTVYTTLLDDRSGCM